MSRAATIRKKVATFTLVLLMSLLLGYGSVLYVSQDLNRNFDALFSKSLMLKSLEDHMVAFELKLDQYLQTKDSDTFVGYIEEQEAIRSLQGQMVSDIQLQNLSALLDHYIQAAEDAILYKRGRNTAMMLERQGVVTKLGTYVAASRTSLQSASFDATLERYLALKDRMNQVKGYMLWIFVVVLILGAVFVFDFTGNVSRPIEALSAHASRMSLGDYSSPLVFDEHLPKTYHEAKVLSMAFNDLAISLNAHIEELKDKAETEAQLRLSAIENLKMQNLLKQAELLALQSQINPHFLFNTINAGLQLAILEDADQTANFLDHMARMFRYNIQRLDNTVTLEDEIRNIQHYYHLMQVRFQDMLVMTFEIEPGCKDLLMPPMILQPIVENALVHGLRNQETPGRIVIQGVRASGGSGAGPGGSDVDGDGGSGGVVLRVTDNGQGMDAQTLEKLRQRVRAMGGERSDVGGALAGAGGGGTHGAHGHTTGIGLNNVYARLSVFFESEAVMAIDSGVDQGTCVTLYLDRGRRENQDADLNS